MSEAVERICEEISKLEDKDDIKKVSDALTDQIDKLVDKKVER